MLIVFVVAGLDAGGAEKIVNALAHHRSRHGDTVHVLALNATTGRSFFGYDAAIGVEPLTIRGRAGTFARLRALRQRLRSLRPDIVISFLTKVNILAALASAGLPCTVIASERNNFLEQPMNPAWRTLFPHAMRRVSCMVMQTERAAASLPAGLRKKAVVIPNFVALPAASAGPATGLRVIATGRLDHQKGFDRLIRAFALACPKIGDVPLVIFGTGPEHDKLQALASELGLGERVTLAGASATPGGWARAGDIFVLSSRFEGFPNVLLEALAAGMATISVDCPWGPAEIIGTSDAAILVDAAGTDALACAITEVARNRSLRKHLAARGPQLAACYSRPDILAQWDAAVARALGERARTRDHGGPPVAASGR